MRIIVAILVLPLALAACNREPDPDKGESPSIRKSLNFANFDRINVTGPDSVIVTRGPRFSVIAEGQEWAVGALEVRQHRAGLEIGRKRWTGATGSGAADAPVLVRITMPALAGATLTGSGGMTVDAVQGDELTLMLTGSGGLTASRIDVKRLTADVTGAGTVRVAGRARTGHLSSQGSGAIEGGALRIDNVSISVMGTGGVTVASDGSASISTLGAGDVTVLGRPRCTMSRTGSGAVRCGG